MNPLRWLRKLSAKAATKRSGDIARQSGTASAQVDARDDEEWIDVDGAAFFNGSKKTAELWREISPDHSRFARITAVKGGACALNVYERRGTMWELWEGPSVMASLEEAQTLARRLSGSA